jgi:hypothetical protein
MKKFLNIIFITEMPMAALRQSISLYCRGAARQRQLISFCRHGSG